MRACLVVRHSSASACLNLSVVSLVPECDVSAPGPRPGLRRVLHSTPDCCLENALCVSREHGGTTLHRHRVKTPESAVSPTTNPPARSGSVLYYSETRHPHQITPRGTPDLHTPGPPQQPHHSHARSHATPESPWPTRRLVQLAALGESRRGAPNAMVRARSCHPADGPRLAAARRPNATVACPPLITSSSRARRLHPCCPRPRAPAPRSPRTRPRRPRGSAGAGACGCAH